MYVVNIMNDYESFTKCTSNDNEVFDVFLKFFTFINPKLRVITIFFKLDYMDKNKTFNESVHHSLVF